jgi:hypothetical protein
VWWATQADGPFDDRSETVTNRLWKVGLVLVVSGTALALAQLRLDATAAPRRATSDLDGYSDAQLTRDLTDELNDIFEGLPPDKQYPLDALEEAILEAFSDDGDEGFESEIDMEDLDEEMEEAQTSLDDVVEAALERADQIAFRETSPSGSVSFQFATFSAQTRNQRGFSTSRVTVQETVRGTVASIRRVRR